MSVYKAPNVKDQPYVRIILWSVRQIHNGDRHLVGKLVSSTRDGRVTSKIMRHEGNLLTTSSGRQYELVGPPGNNPDAEYVWNTWCSHNHTRPQYIDVSHEYT